MIAEKRPSRHVPSSIDFFLLEALLLGPACQACPPMPCQVAPAPLKFIHLPTQV
jgi:hypothetical protein